MSLKFANKLGYTLKDIRPIKSVKIGTAKAGQELSVVGVLARPLRLQVGGHSTLFRTRPLVIDGLSMNFNISGPYMAQQGFDQLHSRSTLLVRGKEIPLYRPGPRRTLASLNAMVTTNDEAYLAQALTVPARSAAYVEIRIPNIEQRHMEPGEGVLESCQHFVEKTDLHPALHALVRTDENGCTRTSVMNTTDEDISVAKGHRFGRYTPLELLDPLPGINALTRGKQPQSPAPDRFTRAQLREKFHIDESPTLHTRKEREMALSLLEEFADLFSTGDQYGKTNLIEHEIDTQDAAPVRCKHRPLNPSLEPQLKEQLDHWLKQDIVEPSTSPWSFALLAVPKKNGKIRWCVDYRRLNDVTVKDSFPLPNIEDNLARLSDSKIFSGIDGTGAYHVVPIKEADRPKTAFSTPWGLYQFKQMSFGLCNAPATYSRLVQKVLNGIPPEVALPYLDDTCVHSRDFAGHLRALRQVFQAHRMAGLMLQPEKCQLFQNQIEYLGHLVSPEGVSIPPKYTTSVVRDWPYPQTLSEVRAFLGKMSYYRKFIPGFSHEAAPLSDFVKKDQAEPIPQTEAALAAFEKLKAKLYVRSTNSCLSSLPQYRTFHRRYGLEQECHRCCVVSGARWP